jgi:rhodanese-related sulfurtransferase
VKSNTFLQCIAIAAIGTWIGMIHAQFRPVVVSLEPDDPPVANGGNPAPSDNGNGATTPGGPSDVDPLPMSDADRLANLGLEVEADDVVWIYQTGGAIFIDARHLDDYVAGHVAGAEHLPPDSVELQALISRLSMLYGTEEHYLIYCEGGDCDSSKAVARHLKAAGFQNYHIFTPGYEILGQLDGLDIDQGEPMRF